MFSINLYSLQRCSTGLRSEGCEGQLDKSNTPLYFMASSAGRGKSRNATELSKILRSLFVDDQELQELKERLDNAMVFNLSFENATAIDLSVERSASNAIGKQMLFQLMESENWLEVRDKYKGIAPRDVLQRISKDMKFNDLTTRKANKPLLNILVNDMGGHARALEALEIAIKGKDLDNCNFAELMNEIRVRLVDRYSEWNFIIPETEIRIAELSQLGLVQFMNDEGETDQG
ncbi:8646_t:CDS:2 [Entrophospora sp. SA101]|nr:8646_t:CDS:2 [Entrophospora sp. SA101]